MALPLATGNGVVAACVSFLSSPLPSLRRHRHCAADTPGYAQENASKPELCLAVNSALGSDLFTPDKASTAAQTPRHQDQGSTLTLPRLAPHPCLPQVARLLLRGIERGQYHLPSADLGQNLLVSGMTSLR